VEDTGTNRICHDLTYIGKFSPERFRIRDITGKITNYIDLFLSIALKINFAVTH
jgi:hypothetical protein